MTFQVKIDGNAPPLCAFSYKRHLESPCGAFSAEIVLEKGESFEAFLGKKVEITLGDNTYHALIEALDFEPRKKVHISGRDEVAIIVDSSADTFEFQGVQDLKDIAKKLCAPYQVTVTSDVEKKMPLESWTVNAGEPVYESLEMASRKFGVFFSSPDGRNLVIAEPSKTVDMIIDHHTPLKQLHIRKDISQVYGEYVIKSGNINLVVDNDAEAISKVEGINPLKKKVVILSNASKEDAKIRAEWEKKTRAIRSITVDATLQGVDVPKIGNLVSLNIEGFKGDFLIKGWSVNIDLNANRSVNESVVSLVPVGAFDD